MCGPDSTARIYDPKGDKPAAPNILEQTLPAQPGDANVQQARFNAILRQRMSGSRMASFLGSNILEGHSLSAPRADGYIPSPVEQLSPFSPLIKPKKSTGYLATPNTGSLLGGP